MKTIIPLIISVFFCIMLNAQSVFAPVVGAKWTYTYNTYGFSFGTSNKTKQILKVSYEKDTIANMKRYKLLNLFTDVIDSTWEPILPSNGIVDYKLTVSRIKRLEKIYFREQNDTLWAARYNTNSESIYFIFKTQPDSFNVLPMTKTYIDSIYTKSINGKILKVWKGKSYYKQLADGYIYDTCQMTFIERIGIIDDIMPYFAFGGHPNSISKNKPWGLVCYEDNEIGNVQFMNIDCNVSAIQNKILEKNIECHYFSEENRIKYDMHDIDFKNWKLILLDMKGNILMNRLITSKENYIELPNKNAVNIYLLHFYNLDNGNYYNKKILIR